MDPILVSCDAGIATVTLNNPGNPDTPDRSIWEQLGAAMRALGADQSLRCVVLRGAGDQAFAAHTGISRFALERANPAQAKSCGALIHATMQAVTRCRHPVVAMIEGACVGGGFEIAAMCDLRICGESASFGVPLNALGLTLGDGELQGVLALAGRAVTLEILLEGRVFSAVEALQKKLVNRVVPDGDVEREAYALAGRIAAGAPLVARWHKQFIDRLGVAPQVPGREWDGGYACFDTEDYRIGVKAFLDKIKPQFTGN